MRAPSVASAATRLRARSKSAGSSGSRSWMAMRRACIDRDASAADLSAAGGCIRAAVCSYAPVVSIDWDDLRFFLAVRRAGTLKGAGAELKTDPTTVGRRLGTLEAQLNTRLFDRTPDGFAPTAAGLRLF